MSMADRRWPDLTCHDRFESASFGSISGRYPGGSIGPGHQKLLAERDQIISCLHTFRWCSFLVWNHWSSHLWILSAKIGTLSISFPWQHLTGIGMFELGHLEVAMSDYHGTCAGRRSWVFWHQPKLSEDNEILHSRGISSLCLLSTLHSPERPCWMLAVPGSSARRALWTYVEGSEHGKTSCTSFDVSTVGT